MDALEASCVTGVAQAACPLQHAPGTDGWAVPGTGGKSSAAGGGADDDACTDSKRPAPTTKRARAAAALAAAQQGIEDDSGSGIDDDDHERMNCDWQKHPAAYIISENIKKGEGLSSRQSSCLPRVEAGPSDRKGPWCGYNKWQLRQRC